MRTIGIRVTPKAVTFAVYDKEQNQIINIETLNVPLALSVPEGLKYLRVNLLDILREYKINRAAIKATESTARRVNIHRVQIEGVIQEAFASAVLEMYITPQISTLAALTGIPYKDFTSYTKGESKFDLVDNWSALSVEDREAVLSALGVANAQ